MHHKHGSKCNDCHHQQQRHLPTSPASSIPPRSSPSPPPLFSRPQGCTGQLTLGQRATIAALHRSGKLNKEITQLIPCNKNSVTRWKESGQSDDSLQDKERSGRPRITDEKTDEKIVSVAVEEKFTTLRRIKNELELDCSSRTIRRRLDEIGLHGCVPETEYVYTEFNIQRSLSFAQGYANMTVDDWSKLIFSDATYIEVFGRSRVWVQRPVGTASDPQYVCQRMPHSDRVALWGCFCARGIGQAEVFVGEFNAAKYVNVLQGNLIQTARHFYPHEGWWLLQDNAPQHTSNLAKTWFFNHGVQLIDFPPYSPDLNPIENL